MCVAGRPEGCIPSGLLLCGLHEINRKAHISFRSSVIHYRKDNSEWITKKSTINCIDTVILTNVKQEFPQPLQVAG